MARVEPGKRLCVWAFLRNMQYLICALVLSGADRDT